MSTNATIAIKNDDDTYDCIYTHWDGYIDHHGPILLNHYNSEKIVREMIELGDMSQLCDNLNPTLDTHSYNSPEENVCVFYGRDRGEENVEPQKNLPFMEYRSQFNEYNYLFQDGEWFVSEGDDFIPL